MVSIYLIHGDPEIYPDPKAFKPERFLNADPKGTEGGAWIPFGGGIRRCLGASLAQYELAVVIRTVLEEAKLSLVEESAEPVARRRFTLSPGREGRVRVESVSPGVSSPAWLSDGSGLRSRFTRRRLSSPSASASGLLTSGCTASQQFVRNRKRLKSGHKKCPFCVDTLTSDGPSRYGRHGSYPRRGCAQRAP